MTRLIHSAPARQQLLAAVRAVPLGVKISIPQLRDHLVSQADVLEALQQLVDCGKLDRATLRPARPPIDPMPRQRGGLKSAARRVTGAELAAELESFCKTHGLARSRVGHHLFGGGNSVARLRLGTPRSAMIDKVRAFLAEPPPLPLIEQLRARKPGGPRVAEVGGITGAELASKLDALIEQHGLSPTRVGLHLVGSRHGLASIRHSNPRRKTVDRILAFLANPPIEELKPRDGWTTRRANQQSNNRGASGTARKASSASSSGDARRDIVRAPKREGEPEAGANRPPAHEPRFSRSFEEQLARVERGEVGIAPNIKIGRPDPAGTLGGVTGEINL